MKIYPTRVAYKTMSLNLCAFYYRLSNRAQANGVSTHNTPTTLFISSFKHKHMYYYRFKTKKDAELEAANYVFWLNYLFGVAIYLRSTMCFGLSCRLLSHATTYNIQHKGIYHQRYLGNKYCFRIPLSDIVHSIYGGGVVVIKVREWSEL